MAQPTQARPKRTKANLMKRILTLLVFVFALSAQAASDRVTITLTITNLPVAAQTLTVNASTRTWRASPTVPATEITIGADVGAAATNLFRQLASYPLTGPVVLGFSSSNVITIQGQTAQAMSASVSAAYATIAYSTNSVTAMDIVRTVGDQSIAGTKTFSGQIVETAAGGILVSNTAPVFKFWDSDADADEKRLSIGYASGVFQMASTSDDGSTSENVFTITFTGTTPTAMTLVPPLTATSLSSVAISGSTMTDSTVTGAVIAGTNAVTGSMRYTRANHTSLANGNNAAVDFGTKVYAKIKAGPTAAFAICGIVGGSDGRELIIWNATGQNMTISHDSGVEPTAANRIYTPTGADVATTGAGSARLIYDSEDSRWVLISYQQ